MEPALHSWSFRNRFQEDDDFDIFRALDLTAEMGFGGIEIMSGKAGGPPGDFASDDMDYLHGVMEHAREVGVRVLSLATYNDFAYVRDEDWRRANIEYVKEWLRIAGELGVPNIRMLTGYYIEGEPRERLEELTLAGIRRCAPVAEEAGVNMALENHNSIFFSADQILWLIEQVGSERLTTCPDPSNWCRGFLTGEAAEGEREVVFQSAAKVAPLATQSHLKVCGVTDDGRLVGWEDDLERLIRTYRDAGYDGALAFESVAEGDLLAPLPQARRVVQDAIDRVGGRP
ncbi:MAG: sugar phosphate isomerase/epimerase family protein [Candidatus Brocadiia bacterium]